MANDGNKLTPAQREKMRLARVKREKADKTGNSVRDFFGVKSEDSRTDAEKKADAKAAAAKKAK